jgi:uncharacterized protein YbaP (TraB family)
MRILRETGILPRMSSSRLRTLLALVPVAAACATLAPASYPAPRETGQLVFWEVESTRRPGARAWLLGSVHAGSPDLTFDPAIEQAFAGSDALVIEADINAVLTQGSDFVRETLKRATLPEGQTLDQLLTKPAWRQLGEFMRKRGQPPEAIRRLEPWLVMTMVTAYYFAEAGLPVSGGVDARFSSRAEGRMPIVPLETPEFQLSLLDSLPLAAQAAMLEAMLGKEDATRQDAIRLYDAWRYGDVDAIESLVTVPFQGDEELRSFRERVIVKRSQNMAARIDDLLAEPRTWFVVVGAGHMVGADGIPAILAGRGHRVTRIAKTAPPAGK